jgi:SAM-dependent methyltransferase
VEIRTHDVALEPPPGESFDLVHARLVLVHVPERERAFRNMLSALKPGGWLVIEDADPALQPFSCIDAYGPEQELANTIRLGFRTLLSNRGADLSFLLGHGIATEAEIEQHLKNVRAGVLDLSQPPMISVRGRKPQ